MTYNPQQHQQSINRRTFLTNSAYGLGAAALSTLLTQTGEAASAAGAPSSPTPNPPRGITNPPPHPIQTKSIIPPCIARRPPRPTPTPPPRLTPPPPPGNPAPPPAPPRQWSAGFLPSKFQGIQFQSKGDAVHYIGNPDGVCQSTQRQVIEEIQRLNGMAEQDQ